MRKVHCRAAIVCAVMIAAAGFSGCTKRPSQEEVAKLEQATAAAEAAERKLAELRMERMALEQQLEAKKRELGENEPGAQKQKAEP